MTKKEKIIAICLCVSMVLVVISSFYTVIKNKPQGYSFNIEKLLIR